MERVLLNHGTLGPINALHLAPPIDPLCFPQTRDGHLNYQLG